MDCIFIGNRFYEESGSIMSSLYTVEGKRTDWGFIEAALRNGKSVSIRPATINEIEQYTKKLNEIKTIKERKIY